VSAMNAFGWRPGTPLRAGIEKAYLDFRTHFATADAGK